MTVESRADAAPYPEVALRGKHWKIPARQRMSTAAMSNWGGSATRFEYVHATVITMNGTSIAAYRRRLRALLCMANPPRARTQRDGHVLERVLCAGQDVRKIARAAGLKCAIGGKGGRVPVVAQAQAGKESQNPPERPFRLRVPECYERNHHEWIDVDVGDQEPES